MKNIKSYINNLIFQYNNFYYKKLNIFFLILLAISLPLSEFFLSVSIISLTVNYILSPNLKNRLKKIYERKSVLAIILIYLIHIIGLIYSSNLEYGLHDLKIKITLPVLTIIMGTGEFPDDKEFKLIMKFFILSLIAGSLISFLVYIGIIKREIKDIREISLYISHIRFALLINIGIFYILYQLYAKELIKHRAFYVISLVWLIIFLFILQSLTGIFVFVILSLFYIMILIITSNKFKFKVFTSIFLFITVTILGFYIYKSIKKFYTINEKNIKPLETYTVNGNKYFHDTLNSDTENGYYIWRYICEEELKNEWQKRSQLPYEGKDLKNQELRMTLIRYLTSKGLKKDSAGMAHLNDNDIKNIEKGIANYIYARKFSLYPKIHEFLWEIEAMKKDINPSGHSIMQRIEFLKTAFSIISKNIILGVGTGDVNDAFKKEYQILKSKLEPQYQLRAHNQLVTFLLTFGIIGFLILIICFIYAIVYEKKHKDLLFILFLIIILISFLNEDTLETHTGMSLFAFFLSLFLFRKNSKK